MRVGTIACACVASVGLCSTMQSSASAQTGVAFAVASIKPNTRGSASVSFGPVPGGYSATNVSLRLLVEAAFRTRAGQVIGGPDWIRRIVLTSRHALQRGRRRRRSFRCFERCSRTGSGSGRISSRAKGPFTLSSGRAATVASGRSCGSRQLSARFPGRRETPAD